MYDEFHKEFGIPGLMFGTWAALGNPDSVSGIFSKNSKLHTNKPNPKTDPFFRES